LRVVSRRIEHAWWDRLFAQSAATGRPLQARLREMVVAAVNEGWLACDAPLPSSRELAQNLGVARNTVLLAYQQLVDDGFLESRERSGYFVRAEVRSRVPAHGPPAKEGKAAPSWHRWLAVRPSGHRNLVKPADWLKYPYPFLYGQFDPTLFPINDWRECARQALSVLEIRGWAPDLVARDDPELVEQIRTRLLPRRGIWVAADEIMVTLGAQQALYLLAELVLRPGMTVGIEDPGYPDARNIFALKEARLCPLPLDDSGVIPEAIPEDSKLLFVTPMRQCPTGVILPLERRHRLLALAAAHDQLIVEDDYESNFGFYMEQPPPTLRSLDPSGRVLYVGSLSKTLAPGLRLGYIVAPPEVLLEARALRRLMLRQAPGNNPRAVALFLALGHHDRLLRRFSSVIGERADAMREAMARHLPEFTYSYGAGGSSFWVRGPDWLDSRALAERARSAGILIEPGDVFFQSATPPLQYFRLGFASIPTERIEPGIRALAEHARARS
jgi:GntR family transcriptional regulator / MocR family aminotransferase